MGGEEDSYGIYIAKVSVVVLEQHSGLVEHDVSALNALSALVERFVNSHEVIAGSYSGKIVRVTQIAVTA